jgi:hypothetical protein
MRKHSILAPATNIDTLRFQGQIADLRRSFASLAIGSKSKALVTGSVHANSFDARLA